MSYFLFYPLWISRVCVESMSAVLLLLCYSNDLIWFESVNMRKALTFTWSQWKYHFIRTHRLLISRCSFPCAHRILTFTTTYLLFSFMECAFVSNCYFQCRADKLIDTLNGCVCVFAALSDPKSTHRLFWKKYNQMSFHYNVIVGFAFANGAASAILAHTIPNRTIENSINKLYECI